MGHATRSEVVIRHLLKKHTVDVWAGGKAYPYLKKKFPTKELPVIKLYYQDGKTQQLKSGMGVLTDNVPKLMPTLRNIMRGRKPDVIISDWEPYTCWAGAFLDIPVVTANNCSLLLKTKVPIKVPKAVMFGGHLATLHAQRHIIPSFTKVAVEEDTILTDIAVRKEIQRLRPETGEHLLVYMTSDTCIAILDVLERMHIACQVYGFGKRARRGKLHFHAFSKTEFLKDLEQARAVVISGGFSLLSEALYLHKPVACVPIESQWEQIMNGMLLQKQGYGMYLEKPTLAGMRRFLKNLPKYREKLANFKPNVNEFARVVEREAEKLVK